MITLARALARALTLCAWRWPQDHVAIFETQFWFPFTRQAEYQRQRQAQGRRIPRRREECFVNGTTPDTCQCTKPGTKGRVPVSCPPEHTCEGRVQRLPYCDEGDDDDGDSAPLTSHEL